MRCSWCGSRLDDRFEIFTARIRPSAEPDLAFVCVEGCRPPANPHTTRPATAHRVAVATNHR